MMVNKSFFFVFVTLIGSGLARPQDASQEGSGAKKAAGNEDEKLGQFYFVDSEYGKNFVKLLHIRREGDKHYIKELEVSTRLTLNSHKEYLDSDNTDVVATDSQKNTVYILARNNGVNTIEEFAIQLVTHFLEKYPFVDRSTVSIEEASWERYVQDSQPHNHVFVSTPVATRFTNVVLNRGGKPQVESGLKNLRVLKTTKSGFEEFVRDEFTSLPDVKDRIFSTNVAAKWTYSDVSGLDYDKAWNTVKQCFMENFAGPPDTGVYSSSVQNTLYLTEKMVLEKIPQVAKIDFELPNIHYIPFDFSKYRDATNAMGNDKDVLIKTDAPSGIIRAVLGRKSYIPK